jgi:ribosomal protein S4
LIKYYKFAIYKKYNDELWGYLINNYNYVNLKHKFLLKLQYFLKKNYFYKKIKSKWIKYKRYKFIKRIRRFNFAFIYYNKRRHWAIRRNIRRNINMGKKKRYKIFKFFKFMYSYLSNKYSYISLKYNFFNFFKIYNNNNINKLKIKKYKYILFIKNKKNLFNYLKRLYKKKNYYKLKSRLKKTLKSDLKYERQFFYSVHIIKPRPKVRYKKFEYKLKPINLLALFFGFKKVKKFQLLWNRKKIKKFLKINNFNDFLFFLESKLETFLFRVNFFHSIYFIKQFIFSKNIFVNNMIIFRPDYNIKLFDIVNINYKFFKWLFKNIKYRLKNKFIFLNIPNYFYVDWGLLNGFIIMKPKIKQINKPYKFLKYTYL